MEVLNLVLRVPYVIGLYPIISIVYHYLIRCQRMRNGRNGGLQYDPLRKDMGCSRCLKMEQALGHDVARIEADCYALDRFIRGLCLPVLTYREWRHCARWDPSRSSDSYTSQMPMHLPCPRSRDAWMLAEKSYTSSCYDHRHPGDTLYLYLFIGFQLLVHVRPPSWRIKSSESLHGVSDVGSRMTTAVKDKPVSIPTWCSDVGSSFSFSPYPNSFSIG